MEIKNSFRGLTGYETFRKLFSELEDIAKVNRQIDKHRKKKSLKTKQELNNLWENIKQSNMSLK